MPGVSSLPRWGAPLRGKDAFQKGVNLDLRAVMEHREWET